MPPVNMFFPDATHVLLMGSKLLSKWEKPAGLPALEVKLPIRLTVFT